jgi:hypothetical protein
MRVLICGGRKFQDADLFNRTMAVINNIDVIIQGGAVGADYMAKIYAFDNKIKMEEYPAMWKLYGIAAGPIRNQKMIDYGKPDMVIAFPGGTGTADMVKRAKINRIKVLEVT